MQKIKYCRLFSTVTRSFLSVQILNVRNDRTKWVKGSWLLSRMYPERGGVSKLKSLCLRKEFSADTGIIFRRIHVHEYARIIDCYRVNPCGVYSHQVSQGHSRIKFLQDHPAKQQRVPTTPLVGRHENTAGRGGVLICQCRYGGRSING